MRLGGLTKCPLPALKWDKIRYNKADSHNYEICKGMKYNNNNNSVFFFGAFKNLNALTVFEKALKIYDKNYSCELL